MTGNKIALSSFVDNFNFSQKLKNVGLEKLKFCKVEYLTFDGKVL